MEACAKHIARVRNVVAPRTAYAVSGKTAKEAVIYTNDASTQVRKRELVAALLKTNEFDSFVEKQASGQERWESQGNVTIALVKGANEDAETSALREARSLISNKQSSLVVILLLPPYGPSPLSAAFPANDGNIVHNTEIVEDIRLISTYANALSGSSSTSSSLASSTAASLGSHGQPSVQSRGQFAYLWRIWQEKADSLTITLDSGKERVLQRLADRSVGPNDEKLTTVEWDKIVQTCLDQGLDDFGVYNAVRVRTLGTSLEHDLGLGSSSFTAPAAEPLKEEGATTTVLAAQASKEGEEGDGRANFMVKMTLQCVPESIKKAFAAPNSAVLDYGCAEGAITAELGRQLGVHASRVFGADVRTIPADGFTFVPLAAEGDVAPGHGQILPSFPAGKFSLITTAMVMHHVSHVHATLLELRRVIAPTGALVLREHHCATPEMATFLDIMHGLYSLAWSQPVEWPKFLQEYKAWYRPQEAWDALCLEAGFVRLTSPQSISSAYEAGQRSLRKKDGRYGNLIRAYYAVYLPKQGFVLPPVIAAVAVVAAVAPPKRSRSEMESSGGDGAGAGDARAAAPSKEVWESKKFKGQFYMLSATGQAIWVKLTIKGTGRPAVHPADPTEIEFLDAQTSSTCCVSKINYCS